MLPSGWYCLRSIIGREVDFNQRCCAGRLSFSWRLAMAPPEVLDYVAAHEAAHLVEMSHGSRYWEVVERIMPDYRRHRAWLKREGRGLHGFRFEAG